MDELESNPVKLLLFVISKLKGWFYGLKATCFIHDVKTKSREKNAKSREKTINRWGEKRIFAPKEKAVCTRNSKNLCPYTGN